MPSQYLQPGDYAAYGVPDTNAQQVTQASLIIDSYLQREEGLIYGTDYLGQPCYMVALSPTDTFKSSGSIAPGNSVVVNTTVPVQAFIEMIGEVLILDRATPSLCEPCVISAMKPGQITLSSVANNHAANCTMDLGMVIFEEKSLPTDRSITRTSRPPRRLLSGMGRYGYGRRTDQTAGMYAEVNLLAEIQAFGGPPMWVPFDINQASVSYTTREVWLPAGILLQYFSNVRLRYVSGWTETSLPPIIKQATAQLIQNFANNPNLQGQIQSIGTGTTKMQRFAASQIDADIRQMIETYRIKIMI